jgi:hypothetical protein
VKEQICKAFCNDLSVRQTDSGYAISTPYNDVYGDPIGFYAMLDQDGRYRLVDNGSTVAFLEAAGADLESKTRYDAFHEILSEYRAEYSEERGELAIPFLAEEELPQASLQFMALLLRLRDLLLITRENVESTFREDIIAALHQRFEGHAEVNPGEPVSPKLSEVIPDVVLRAPNRDPVALFLASTDHRVNEAIYLQMVAEHEAHVPVSVIAMLETDSSVSRMLRQRADNRLDAVPRYRKDERAAIERVAREVLGRDNTPPLVH